MELTLKNAMGKALPVEWEFGFWEDVFERSVSAMPRVAELIDEVAAINGRPEYNNEQIEADLGIE